MSLVTADLLGGRKAVGVGRYQDTDLAGLGSWTEPLVKRLLLGTR